jgi:hypothetical protein
MEPVQLHLPPHPPAFLATQTDVEKQFHCAVSTAIGPGTLASPKMESLFALEIQTPLIHEVSNATRQQIE